MGISLLFFLSVEFFTWSFSHRCYADLTLRWLCGRGTWRIKKHLVIDNFLLPCGLRRFIFTTRKPFLIDDSFHFQAAMCWKWTRSTRASSRLAAEDSAKSTLASADPTSIQYVYFSPSYCIYCHKVISNNLFFSCLLAGRHQSREWQESGFMEDGKRWFLD